MEEDGKVDMKLNTRFQKEFKQILAQVGNSTIKQKPKTAIMNISDPTFCDPPCSLNGICVDNCCLCKHPFTGISCSGRRCSLRT